VGIIFEYADGGSLADMRKNYKKASRQHLPAEVLRCYAMQILLALDHLSRPDIGIVHRDLKPANVLLLGDGTVKLGDFGSAKEARPTDEESHPSVAGSTWFTSPEGLGLYGKPVVNEKTDIWSFGILMWMLLDLQMEKPFGNTTGELLQFIQTKEDHQLFQSRYEAVVKSTCRIPAHVTMTEYQLSLLRRVVLLLHATAKHVQMYVQAHAQAGVLASELQASIAPLALLYRDAWQALETERWSMLSAGEKNASGKDAYKGAMRYGRRCTPAGRQPMRLRRRR